jgi:O-antigen/teichoic acid export membrane protein
VTAALSAFFGKGMSLLVNVVTVPITVRYLGPESFGLWITISSTVTMFFVLDIGISNTLINLVSEAYARDDRNRAAEYFSTAFWILVGVVGLLSVVGWVIWPHVQWAAIFNVRNPALIPETSRAMAAAFVVFLFSLPTGLATKVLAGYQELHVANLFATGGSILSLVVVLVVVYLHGGLAALVAGYAGSTAVANLACLLWMSFSRKPWMKPWPRRFRPRLIGPIFSSGTQFFAIQMAGLIVFSSDNLIISHYLSPVRVTPYAVTWRLFNYIVALQSLFVPALWPAYSEAYATGHLEWIRSTYSRVRRFTVIALAAGCTIMLFEGRSIIRIWAGPAAVPTTSLVWLMCVWIAIFAFSNNQSCLMMATNRVGKQAVLGPLAALVNLGLSILWVKTIGPVGVLLATVLSYLVFIVAMQSWEVKRIMRGDFLQGGV